MSQEEITTKQIWGGILLVVLLIGGYILADGFLSWRKGTPVAPPTPTSTVVITPAPSEFPDFDALKNLNKLQIVENFESWTPSAAVQDNKTVNTIIVEKGELSKAYVYIRASLDGKALTKWESVYLKMNWVGGHVFRPRSLKVPPSEKTELLFALNEVYYLPKAPYSEFAKFEVVDWFRLFKDKKEIPILSFISSLRPAKIEDVSLYYQCVEEENCELRLK